MVLTKGLWMVLSGFFALFFFVIKIFRLFSNYKELRKKLLHEIEECENAEKGIE